ncbi:unnamed protein product, partial [Meganyctiphanes norvegica]
MSMLFHVALPSERRRAARNLLAPTHLQLLQLSQQHTHNLASTLRSDHGSDVTYAPTRLPVLLSSAARPGGPALMLSKTIAKRSGATTSVRASDVTAHTRARTCRDATPASLRYETGSHSRFQVKCVNVSGSGGFIKTRSQKQHDIMSTPPMLRMVPPRGNYCIGVVFGIGVSDIRKLSRNFFLVIGSATAAARTMRVFISKTCHLIFSWLNGASKAKINIRRDVLVTVSMYSPIALSVMGRYNPSIHCNHLLITGQRARRLVIVAWILSAIFASPSLYLFSEVEYHCRTQCWLHMPEVIGWELYVWLVALTVFIFPTILITACYAIIVYTIWSKSTTMNVPSKPRAVTNGEKRGGSNHEDDSRRASSRGLIPKAKIKTVKMTLVIVFVFILCWSPYIVYNLMDVHGYIPKDLLALTTLIQSLASLNSAANPLIYCLFSTHICRNLRRIPAINWLVMLFSPCLECARQPLEPAGPFRRYGTEYTTMTSDISSRRQTNNNPRYNPVVLQKDMGNSVTTSSTVS